MYAAAYIWAKVLVYLEKQLSEISVSASLDDAEPVELRNDQLILYSPSELRQETIRKKYVPYIQDAMKELFQMDVNVVVWGDRERQQHSEVENEDPVLLNPQFTFDNYVTGESNKMAGKIARAAAKEPGSELYNPLFLYGPPGVGKTHLLYAIANQIRQEYPKKNVVYVKGDQFTDELVRAIRNGNTAAFKKKYRQNPDVLLIDDIQFIAGKESTQEEFFHTFNALFERRKQIVMTADRKPGDMATLEERLRSRFGSGIMVAIEPPDRDTRRSIIKAKAQTLWLKLDDETVQYMADHLTRDVRQIEGALKKISAVRDLSDMELTLDNVARTIEDACSGEQTLQITATTIIKTVCRYFDLEEETLRGPQKSRGIAEPRQIAMYLIRTMLGLSFPEIGAVFGKRDHSTVQHSVKKVESVLQLKGNHLDGIIWDIQSNIENAAN